MLINIEIPSGWDKLSNKQLRYVYGMMAENFTLPEMQVLCLIKWAKLKILGKKDDYYILEYVKQKFLLSPLQLAEVLRAMEWMGRFPDIPVRMTIGRHRPVAADFQGVSFSNFLALDNFYMGYLQTKKSEMAVEMAKIMYRYKKFTKLTPEEEINVIWWFTAVKKMFSRLFRHFFRESEGSPSQAITYQFLQENMNTQIRALTGGDITKEEQVLDMDCWRALTELDAKAKDYEEMERARKK